jgi:hypothetical protein
MRVTWCAAQRAQWRKRIELPATNQPSSVKLVRSAVPDGVATAIELGYS